MTPDDIRQKIELDVVEMIKAKLGDGSMTENRGQEISQMVLHTLKPGMTWEDLYEAIFTLDDNCPELSSIVLPYTKQYEEQVTQKTIASVENYIKTGQYDAAVKLAEDTIHQNVRLKWQGSGKVN